MAKFVETVAGIRRGKFLELVNRELTEVSAAVHATGAKGEVAVVLTMTPNGEGQVTVKARVKIKKPLPDVGDAIFYVTEDGELERQDPRQRDLEDALPEQFRGRDKRDN